MNLNVNIESRGNKLRAVFYENGVRKRVSLGFNDTPTNRKHCERVIVPKIITNLAIGKAGIPSIEDDSKKSLSYFINRALKKTEDKKKIQTFRTYTYASRSLYSFFGESTPISSISAAKIEDYISYCEEKRLSASTICVYVAFLRRVFKEAMKANEVMKNEAALAEKPSPISTKPTPKVFNLFQIQRLFNEASGGLKIWLALEAFSGLRVGEILALRWSDINFDNSTINVDRTLITGAIYNLPKNGKKRVVKMVTSLCAFLAAEYKSRDIKDGYIVLSPRGEAYKSAASMYTLWQKHQNKLGFAPQGTHILRHTFASLALQAGESKSLVKDMLGHIDESLLDKIYAHHISTPKDYEEFSKVAQF